MISIIIPIYNTKKYLKECLDSVKNQTFLDYEALLIDDGCADGSTGIIKEYCNNDSRFKYLGGDHIGFPKAKNLGLDSAKGKYICFLDSDDFLEPDYLELLYKGIKENNSDICCCKYRSFNDKIIHKCICPYKAKNYTSNKFPLLFSPDGTTFMWNKIYRREIFDSFRFEDVIALSDTMLCYKLFDKATKITSIQPILINHRVHNENMTYRVRRFEPTYWKHRLNVYLDMYNYLSQKDSKNKCIYWNKLKLEYDNCIRFLDKETANKYTKIIELLKGDLNV